MLTLRLKRKWCLKGENEGERQKKNKTNTEGAVCLDMYAEDIKCTNLLAFLAWRYWL